MQIIDDGDFVYGIQLPVQAQSTIFVADWETAAGPDELAAMALTADQAGFFYIAVCDHIAIPERLAGAMSTTWYDTVATLGFLAGVTERVKLLSHIYVLGYRHAAVSAHSFATLDHLSKGRVILGVGAGHVAEEFELLGVDFASRGKLLDERIDQVKLHLTHEFVDGLGSSPRPVQQPRPAIWVGGSAPASIRRAARKGDGWLPQGISKADLPGAIDLLTTTREQAGISESCAVGAIADFYYLGEPSWDAGPTLSGSAERIAEDAREWRDLGVQHLQIRFRSRSVEEQCDQMARFGAEVAPLLNG
jgi:probable F420-dependent oxidoreductase